MVEPLKTSPQILNSVLATLDQVIEKKVYAAYESMLKIYQYLAALKVLSVERKIKMIESIKKIVGHNDEKVLIKIFQILLILLDPKDPEITQNFVDMVSY